MFLSQVERGEKSISLNTLTNICDVAGVSSDYILFGDKNGSTISKRILKILEQLPSEADTMVYDLVSSLRDLCKNSKK